jgi:hypothetical protein
MGKEKLCWAFFAVVWCTYRDQSIETIEWLYLYSIINKISIKCKEFWVLVQRLLKRTLCLPESKLLNNFCWKPVWKVLFCLLAANRLKSVPTPSAWVAYIPHRDRITRLCCSPIGIAEHVTVNPFTSFNAIGLLFLKNELSSNGHDIQNR